jgi:hypothetical protein
MAIRVTDRDQWRSRFNELVQVKRSEVHARDTSIDERITKQAGIQAALDLGVTRFLDRITDINREIELLADERRLTGYKAEAEVTDMSADEVEANRRATGNNRNTHNDVPHAVTRAIDSRAAVFKDVLMREDPVGCVLKELDDLNARTRDSLMLATNTKQIEVIYDNLRRQLGNIANFDTSHTTSRYMVRVDPNPVENDVDPQHAEIAPEEE